MSEQPLATTTFSVTEQDRRRNTWRQYRVLGTRLLTPTALCLVLVVATHEPVFIGGSVAFIAQVLLLLMMGRRSTRGHRAPPNEVTVDVYADRIRWASPNTVTEFGHNEVRSSHLTKAGLVIAAGGHGILVPRRAFDSDQEFEEFVRQTRPLAPELRKPGGFQAAT